MEGLLLWLEVDAIIRDGSKAIYPRRFLQKIHGAVAAKERWSLTNSRRL